jgi:putative transcriptional regulator
MKNTINVERAKHRISQENLAEKVGVSRQTINSIELGKKKPSVELALKIAQQLKVTVEDIFQLTSSVKHTKK